MLLAADFTLMYILLDTKLERTAESKYSTYNSSTRVFAVELELKL